MSFAARGGYYQDFRGGSDSRMQSLSIGNGVSPAATIEDCNEMFIMVQTHACDPNEIPNSFVCKFHRLALPPFSACLSTRSFASIPLFFHLQSHPRVRVHPPL